MERHKSTFDLSVSMDALDLLVNSCEVEKKTSKVINTMADTVERLWKVEVTQERKTLLHSVGAENADEAYRVNAKLHQQGKGVWFLKDGKPFREWLTTPAGSKLWVYGISGAGKTVLSALAIGRTAETATSNHGVGFFYCSHRDDKSRNLTGTLGCLIGQFARQSGDCMSMVAEKAGLHENTSMQTWTRDNDELLMIIRKMLRHFRHVSIIIDGVVECHEPSLVTETLADLASDLPHIRLLIFSRKESEMAPFLQTYEKLSIAAESQDLRLYVPAQIEERTRLRKLRIRDPNVKDEIVERLVNGADGM